MSVSLAKCLCSDTLTYQILTYGCITMRQHVMRILYLSMTLTFDLYVGGVGILSEYYSQFLSCFFKNLLLQSQAQVRQSKYIVMMTNEELILIVNFITPGEGVHVPGCGHISYDMKMHYFFQNLFLYSQAQVRQSQYIVMMTSEESTKTVRFMTPGAGVLVPGCGRKSHISKSTISFKSFSTLGNGSDKHKKTVLMICLLIPVVLTGYLAAVFLPLLIFIYSMMGLLICKYQPF